MPSSSTYVQARERGTIASLTMFGPQGELITDQQQLGTLYFSYQRVLDRFAPSITSDIITYLSSSFSVEEIFQAVFQMNPLGATGPDGFPAHFYQSHWPIIYKDVYYFVLNVLNNQETLD